jgi:hypothetical protein
VSEDATLTVTLSFPYEQYTEQEKEAVVVALRTLADAMSQRLNAWDTKTWHVNISKGETI